MYKLVLLRHGESQWNQENRFTGWHDVDLSTKGMSEAKAAGLLLKQAEFSFDIAFTSLLKRAIKTLWLALDAMDQDWIPVEKSWRLNERHYGALQGLNKNETVEKHGEQQVQLWRRSYDIPPPAITQDDPRYPGKDRRYSHLTRQDMPVTECLKDTVARFLPYYHERIEPMVAQGKQVLIVAHGNSLRALVKHLDNLTETEVLQLNIPTGIPLVYNLDAQLKPMGHNYLGDPEQVAAAIAGVANQTKKSSH